MRFTKFLATTGAVFLALAGAQVAEAQEATVTDGAPNRTESGGLDEIIVTAERRKENLQDTPISISVLTADALDERAIVSLVDLGDGSVPSLKVAPFFSRPGALIVNIRGVGVLSDSNQPGRDQGVGIYVDGVYLGRPQALGTALFDVESIEVLKGPQGSLFGRNTEGGAVNIVTKRPTGEFGLEAKAGVGNFNAYTGEFRLNLPAIANVAFKLDGVVSSKDGWVDNPLITASDFAGYEKSGLNAQLLWTPTENFTANYSFDTSRDETSTLYQQLLAPGSLPIPAAALQGGSRAENSVYGVPQQPSVGIARGHRLTLEWAALPNLTVKSISGFRDLKQGQYDNGSASTAVGRNGSTFLNQDLARYSLANFRQEQVSEELQVIGEVPRLKYAFGGLYYREVVQDNAVAVFTNTFTTADGSANVLKNINIPGLPFQRASKVKTTSLGVFGQATYTPPIFGDALHLTVGGRYTEDNKKGALLVVNGALPPALVVGGAPGVRRIDKTSTRFDPTINIGYDVTDDILVYGKYSTGYRSGGSNSRSLENTPFDEESVEIFEIGGKTEFLDNRLRVNFAAYTGTYKDIQLDFSAPYFLRDASGNLVVTTRTTTRTINAPGDGDVDGFELEVDAALTDALTMSANYSYNKVKIPATVNPFPIDERGVINPNPIRQYPVYTPENSWSVAFNYERPFGELTFMGHVDFNYAEGQYVNNVDPSATIRNPLSDDSFIVNGRIALTDIPAGAGKATVSLWSRNLLDEEYVFAKFISPTQGTGGFFNEPRTFGVEFAVKM